MVSIETRHSSFFGFNPLSFHLTEMAIVRQSIAVLERHTLSCCREFFGTRSKFLSPVKSTIEGLMKLYIYRVVRIILFYLPF